MSGVCKNGGLFYFNSATQFQTSLLRQSGSLGHPSTNTWANFSCHGSQWMSEYWWTWKIYGANLFPSLAEQGRRSRHYNPKGGVHLSQYSEYSGWSSERDINLTLKCWVFICLWEMWGVHQMTVPILQKPLTVATHPTASAFVAWAHRFLSIQVERPWLNLGSYFMCQFVNKPGSGFSR